MRRSNSSQRGSLLDDKSIAPPDFQNAGQCSAFKAFNCAKPGKCSVNGLAFATRITGGKFASGFAPGQNAYTNSSAPSSFAGCN